MIANKGFGLGDGTGPAEESKRTKRVQGWSRQIRLGALFAIHTKLFSQTVNLSFQKSHCLKFTIGAHSLIEVQYKIEN